MPSLADNIEETEIPQTASTVSWGMLFLRLLCCCLILLISYAELSPLWILIISAATIIGTRDKISMSVKQKTIQNLARDEKEFISNVTAIPSWVHFNEVETTEWINVLVNKIWPLISFTVKDILKRDMIPLINSILPTIFQPCKLVYFNLGDVSPRIGGVKVMAGSHSSVKEILIDLDLYYNGNAEIKLQIGRLIRFTAITAGVKDIELTGKMRIFVYPVKESSSLIGAIALTFLNNPNIKFSLSELNLLKTPGLHEAIKGVLNKVVANILVLPNRLNLKISKDIDLFHQINPLPQGILKIHVIEAKNLQMPFHNIFSENLQPYCIFTVGSQKFYTRVLNCKEDNAIWNEKFEALIHQRQGQTLKVDLYSISIRDTNDQFLGTRSIELLSVWRRGSKQMWLQLEGVRSGLLLVSLTWYELSSDPNDVPYRQGEDDMGDTDLSDAFLAVYLESAEHLKPVADGKISPYAILRLDDQEFRSKVERDTFNPTWKASFNFRIYDISTSTLNIQIKDYISGENLGNLVFFVKHLLHKENMSANRSYNISENNDTRLNLYLRLKALRSRASLIEDGHEPHIRESKRFSTNKINRFNVTNPHGSTGDGLERNDSEEEDWKDEDIAALKVNIEYSLADELVVTIIKGYKYETLYENDSSKPRTTVSLWVEPSRSADEMVYQTPVESSFYPNYDETFLIKMKRNDLSHSYLKFIIKDKASPNRVVDIGHFWINLYDMEFHKSIEHWFTIFPMNVTPPETEL